MRAYHVPCLSHDWFRVCLSTGGLATTYSHIPQEYLAPYLLVHAYQQFWHGYPYGVYQQFTFVTHANQPSASTRYCSEHLHSVSRRKHTHVGDTLSEELHTPPLPVTHVFLGYRWSYNGSAAIPDRQWLDNDKQSFRSCLQLNRQGPWDGLSR